MIPFFLIHHLFLVFFITTLRVSGHGNSFDETDPVEDFETDYFHELPNTYERVVFSEEPLGRLIEIPHSGHSRHSGGYYFVEEPVVRECPPPRKPVKLVQEVDCPTYFEEVLMPPSRPPYRAPMQVFEDTDMC